MNDRALSTLTAWAQQFPDRKPEHYCFPSEQYGLATNNRVVKVCESHPTNPTTTVQEAWQRAKRRCNVKVRLHDLRHTACTRLFEGGIPLTVVGEIMGWAGSTMVLMAKRYGHVSQSAKQEALAVLDRPHQSEQDTATSQQVVEPSTTVN